MIQVNVYINFLNHREEEFRDNSALIVYLSWIVPCSIFLTKAYVTSQRKVKNGYDFLIYYKNGACGPKAIIWEGNPTNKLKPHKKTKG